MDLETKNEYLPLFRKYRPQSFKDVIGQDFTVKALSNAIKLNKIANAYLFCGPRGTGKTSSARIFAKSLNCINGPTVEPCQKCQSCLDVTNASGLDVIEIDAATNRGIDDAKELINKVQYAPMNGKYKIFIIDEVHMLSKEAFNALLKTFEEPPKNVIFILATTEPHKVIETIVSRCQRFDFRRITIDDIVKRLREISDIEKINITDDALYSIAKNVSGGMRDSLALLDQASILGIEKQITKETIEDLIGKLTFDVLFNLTDTILKGDIETSIKEVEKIYEKGSDPRNFVENYIEFLRNIILILSSKNEDEVSNLTLISKENIQKIKENALFEQKKLIKILDKVIDFYKEIKTATNPYIWAELMIINISNIDILSVEAQVQIPKNFEVAQKPQTTTAQAKVEIKKEEIKQPEIKKEVEIAPKPVIEEKVEPETRIEKEPKQLQPEPNEPEPIQTEQPSAQISGDPSKIWTEILNKVESIPAKFFYSGVGKLINIENNKITLGFVNQNALAQAKSDNKYNPLIKAIKLILGENGAIEFVTITDKTKIIDTKINVKISNPQPKPEYQAPKMAATNAVEEKPTVQNKENFQTEPKEEKEPETPKQDLSHYTRTTKEMLEVYNGRVIE